MGKGRYIKQVLEGIWSGVPLFALRPFQKLVHAPGIAHLIPSGHHGQDREAFGLVPLLVGARLKIGQVRVRIAKKQKTSLSRSRLGPTKWPEVRPAERGLDIEVVFAVGIDVVVVGRGEMREVAFLDAVALGPEVLDRGREIDGVPGDHRVGHKVEATGLICLVLGLALPELSGLGEEEEAA